MILVKVDSDIPESCQNCRLAYYHKDEDSTVVFRCVAMDSDTYYRAECFINSKLNHCPIVAEIPNTIDLINRDDVMKAVDNRVTELEQYPEFMKDKIAKTIDVSGVKKHITAIDSVVKID